MGLVSIFLLKGIVALLLWMGNIKASSADNVAPVAAIQGVVYCKPCKYQGVETFLEASPIPGAVVKLFCHRTGYHGSTQTDNLYATTDKNGYFFIHPFKNYKLYGADQCSVFLESSPQGLSCNKATDIHQGVTGAHLIERTSFFPRDTNFQLFTVGPFAFEPSSCPS